MNTLKIESPLYLIRSNNVCWRCHALVPVVAIGCFKFAERDPDTDEWDSISEFDNLVILSNIVSAPKALLEKISKAHPHFEKRHSQTAGEEYWMNVCPECRSHFGDFFMHSEPDGAFYPTTQGYAEEMTLHELDLDGVLELDATYGIGAGDLIWEYGKRGERI